MRWNAAFRQTAEWYVRAFNFTIVNDDTRVFGDRFVRCMSEGGGLAVNISGARTGEKLGPGDANPHHGLEHFGFDSTDIEGRPRVVCEPDLSALPCENESAEQLRTINAMRRGFTQRRKDVKEGRKE